MKKVILMMAFFMSFTVFAQKSGFSIGANVGFPTGNLDDVSSFAFGGDVNYLFDVNDKVKLGAASGVVIFTGKEVGGVKPENKTFIPIAGAIRFNNTGFGGFFAGTDLGYAIGLSPDGENGGLYFKPVLGYEFNNTVSLNIFYTGIKKKNPTYGYPGVGLMFRL